MGANSFGEGETGRRCSFFVRKGAVEMTIEEVISLLELLAVVIKGIPAQFGGTLIVSFVPSASLRNLDLCFE